MSKATLHFEGASGTESAVDWLLSELGSDARVATPLGLGKPNTLLNALYRRVKGDSKTQLILFTALSLNPPSPKEDLAKRFFVPFRDRHWGKDYPELDYAKDAVRGKTPKNIKIHEFYFQAGAALSSDSLQRNYISVNYTHVAETVAEMRVAAVLQLVARKVGPDGRARYSLSSNPDLTLDVSELYKKQGKPMRIVGVVHPDLPFLEGDAEVSADFFAAIVDPSGGNHELFALPRTAIDEIDHRIGFHASRLIADDGTLQIGIGSLSDAVVASLLVRHKENSRYREMARELGGPAIEKDESLEPFTAGLYGLSEMVTDGFMHLRRAGILKREVVDEASGTKTFLHGAFFLGSKPFYEWLRTMPKTESDGVRMTRVSKVNDLFDPNEVLLRLQRKRPRFLNTCMQASLLGGAASETLENGRVVSGVGGQYNFVAMSHELHQSRSILMLRSFRVKNGKRISNIVWSHGMMTIPRHLRDIVVTEYGVADLRGVDDETCIKRMLAITDSEFQAELMETAKRNGKLAKDYVLPESVRGNTETATRESLGPWKKKGYFADYPFGSDFTDVEQNLVRALGRLKEISEKGGLTAKLKLLALALKSGGKDFAPELARMGLSNPKNVGEILAARTLRSALQDLGA